MQQGKFRLAIRKSILFGCQEEGGQALEETAPGRVESPYPELFRRCVDVGTQLSNGTQ